MLAKKCFVLLCFLVAFGSCGFLDSLQKCSIEDEECHKKTFQGFFKDFSKTGIPELNINPFDPITLKDVSISILGQADLTMVEGNLRGLRGCVVNHFKPNIEKGKALLDITCDLLLKGHYKAFSNSPLLKSISGGETLHGDGRAKVKIDKLNIKIDFNFGIVRKNGDIYIKGKDEKLKYKYDVLGKISFAVDNLYIGDQESSALITRLLNENWRQVMKTAGDSFIERGIDALRTILKNFFDNVPAKHIIAEDLTPYVTN